MAAILAVLTGRGDPHRDGAVGTGASTGAAADTVGAAGVAEDIDIQFAGLLAGTTLGAGGWV